MRTKKIQNGEYEIEIIYIVYYVFKKNLADKNSYF